ncbi:hypothetical protein B0T25DRAFT_573187 [Lasiosphaeria hispida]|uniref:Uncharacterized protein n=1 Tax=Lasiosphaeria hispida TaxID=260671 RepID=A0AAJ0MA41_9PEZI|nr:hypothetical protein B0T25DRAFT_573187 [Lasiosphaeria hispida]
MGGGGPDGGGLNRLGHRLDRPTKSAQSSSYLLLADLLGLHEGDALYEKNPIREAQFYSNCIQLEVVGDGAVELPQGGGVILTEEEGGDNDAVFLRKVQDLRLEMPSGLVSWGLMRDKIVDKIIISLFILSLLLV